MPPSFLARKNAVSHRAQAVNHLISSCGRDDTGEHSAIALCSSTLVYPQVSLLRLQ